MGFSISRNCIQCGKLPPRHLQRGNLCNACYQRKNYPRRRVKLLSQQKDYVRTERGKDVRRRANAKYLSRDDVRARRTEYQRFYRAQAGREKYEEYKKRDWYRNNAKKGDELRKERLAKATPPWQSPLEIQRFHSQCPVGHEVDHVVPIAALPNVCGLNVIYNLCYLSPEQHKQKTAKERSVARQLRRKR